MITIDNDENGNEILSESKVDIKEVNDELS